MEEQQADVARQRQLKYLAQVADERWASKPSFLDKPKDQVQTAPEQNRQNDIKKETENTGGAKSAVDTLAVKPTKENPWAKHAGNPGQDWQPEAWTPGPKRRGAHSGASITNELKWSTEELCGINGVGTGGRHHCIFST